MSITTKVGDKGKTSLLGGKMVDKDHVIIEACGTLDELCSFLGMAKSFLKNKQAKNIIATKNPLEQKPPGVKGLES